MQRRYAGLMVGSAVGDALGLPSEGLGPRRIARLYPGPLQHRLVLGAGMISDDTEHAVLVAESLLVAPEQAGKFQRALAWKLRWWFAGLPAGIGLATLRACIKLWLGFPPRFAGVRSAGNGPAGIPNDWKTGIKDWPRGIPLLERLADALPQAQAQHPIAAPSYLRAGVLPRNLIFLLIVLVHGFRRLLPPY